MVASGIEPNDRRRDRQMGLRVNTNVTSINAQRNLSTVTERLSGNFRRLSTGLRISTAADDAAGLAISERLRSQVRSLEQAKRNANDGISFVQTAEGALNEVSSILTRLRELAIQSANGSVSNKDRDTLDEEFQSLVSEVNRIGTSTEFNGISTVSFQVGFGTTAGVDTLNITLQPALTTTLSLNSLDIGSGGSTTTAITNIDTAINTVSGLRGTLGAIQNRLGSTINNLAIQVENLSAAESRIRDVDVAYETAQLTRNSILQQASIAVLSQANSQPQSALQLLQG
jgi:flagellin